MNKYDKVIYDFHSKNHQVSGFARRDDFYEVIHYLYTNQATGNVSEALDETTFMQMNAKACKGRMFRSFDVANSYFEAMSTSQLDSDRDSKAKFQNAVYKDDFKQVMRDSQHDSSQVEDIIGISSGEGATAYKESIPEEWELKVRHELQQLMKLDRVKDILKLYGDFTKFINGSKRRNKVFDPSAKSNIVKGDNIKDATISEMMAYVMPETEILMKMRLASKSMSVFDRTKPKPVGGGAVVVCLDISQSMDYGSIKYQGNIYSNLDTSIAMCMALLKSMSNDKRDVELCTFNEELSSLGSTKDNKASELILKLLKLKTVGGTNIGRATQQCLDRYSNSEDVFLITDAEDTVRYPDDILKRKGDRQIGMLQIGNAVTSNVESMKKFVDNMVVGTSSDNLEQFMKLTI